MPEPLEQRVAELEKQVAELMTHKRRLDREPISKVLQSALSAIDAYHVHKDNDVVPNGIYCADCWDLNHTLTPLDVGAAGIPRANQPPLSFRCPKCNRDLRLQYEDLL